jgi:RNA polymerase sigma-70 factor (ECF subfamily)
MVAGSGWVERPGVAPGRFSFVKIRRRNVSPFELPDAAKHAETSARSLMSNLQVQAEWPTPERNVISSLFSGSDEQAMWKVRTEDDHQAFAQLVQRWEQPIFRLCARMTGDAHRGEDLKQEAFKRVFDKRKEYQIQSKFSTWLWRIALNLCYDELRSTKRRARHFDERNPDAPGAESLEDASDEPTPFLRLVQQEEGELVRRALLRLDETFRTVLVLRYCESLKLREIAELLDLAESSVHHRISVGLAQLTRLLEPQFDERKAALHKLNPPNP